MPFKSLSLTQPQREALLSVYRTTHDADLRTRCQMILLFDDGHTAEQVSTLTFFDHNTILVWRRRFEEEDLGGLLDRPRSGRPRKSHSLL